MRPIKFRAWDKNLKRMCIIREITWAPQGHAPFITSYAVKPLSDTEIDKQRQRTGNPNWELSSYPDEFELMQFTGLLDKNGVEIYEGDIIEYIYTGAGNGIWKDNPPMTGAIEWNSTGWVYKPITGKKFASWLISMPGMNAENSQKMCKVIGDIYKNPELLKG